MSKEISLEDISLVESIFLKCDRLLKLNPKVRYHLSATRCLSEIVSRSGLVTSPSYYLILSSLLFSFSEIATSLETRAILEKLLEETKADMSESVRIKEIFATNLVEAVFCTSQFPSYKIIELIVSLSTKLGIGIKIDLLSSRNIKNLPMQSFNFPSGQELLSKFSVCSLILDPASLDILLQLSPCFTNLKKASLSYVSSSD